MEGHVHSSNFSVLSCACHSMNLHQHTVGISDLTSRHHSTPHTCSGLLTVPQTHQAFPWLRDFVLPGLHSGIFFTLITAEFTPSFHLSLLKYHLSLETVSNDCVLKKKKSSSSPTTMDLIPLHSFHHHLVWYTNRWLASVVSCYVLCI